jgi:hypothetical protein
MASDLNYYKQVMNPYSTYDESQSYTAYEKGFIEGYNKAKEIDYQIKAKIKARELIDKMYYCQRYVDGENYIPLEAYKRAKQCALIVVDEIIDNFGTLTEGKQHYSAHSTIKYYEEVKEEIDKLLKQHNNL